MARVIKMPRMGEGMEEGQIVSWMANVGDKVEKGAPLFEVLTDKTTMEFPCPETATLLKILVETEEDYDCGTPVCIIGEEGEDISGLV
ncbi:biotin/lipoyl-containing protein [uncultured Oscillibacter sp.]|uniref:biotin/lipoyl-containing protein n=1 Tax=uncultured Oscillibacter sp. TaxID=876091 RepID=UPI002617D2E9|nr:biotin/lipoyl-containing protein [uncultured Oscillibacter sp.]